MSEFGSRPGGNDAPRPSYVPERDLQRRGSYTVSVERAKKSEGAREGSWTLRDQFADFLERSTDPDPRTRGRFMSPNLYIAVRRMPRSVGDPVVSLDYASGKKDDIRPIQDCLDVSDVVVDGETMDPLEEFVQVAFDSFPGDAIKFENVDNPKIAKWCEEHGWGKMQREREEGFDYYLELPPYEERQSEKIITTTWTRGPEIFEKSYPEEDGSS